MARYKSWGNPTSIYIGYLPENMRLGRCALLLGFLLARTALAQNLAQAPALLNTIPKGATSANPYWQHVVVTLSRDPVPGNAIHLSLPEGVQVADTDGDGSVEDEITIDDAAGGYQSAAGSTASKVVAVSPGAGPPARCISSSPLPPRPAPAPRRWSTA